MLDFQIKSFEPFRFESSRSSHGVVVSTSPEAIGVGVERRSAGVDERPWRRRRLRRKQEHRC